MKIENARYTKEPSRPDGNEKVIGINCKVNGKPFFVSLDDDNRHYREIKRQVDAGTLTIAEAD